MVTLTRRFALAGLAGLAALGFAAGPAAAQLKEVRIDWATYNPVSLVLKDQGLLEKEFAKDGISIRWVQSAGSNKALEFLNAGSLDFAPPPAPPPSWARSTATRSSRSTSTPAPSGPRSSTKGDSAIKTVADLKGKRVAVTRGTDPHIFLVRALAENKLTEKDVKLVLLQHADGRLALERGDVEAWAGLDPIMASAEIEGGARLFYRKPEANTWGVLNVREEFAKANPDVVKRVLKVYEEARKASLANRADLVKSLVAATKLPETVIARQLERTELTHGPIGPAQAETIVAAGLALQEAGVLDAKLDVKATVAALIEPKYLGTAATQ